MQSLISDGFKPFSTIVPLHANPSGQTLHGAVTTQRGKMVIYTPLQKYKMQTSYHNFGNSNVSFS
jgi:hypothetical protein